MARILLLIATTRARMHIHACACTNTHADAQAHTPCKLQRTVSASVGTCVAGARACTRLARARAREMPPGRKYRAASCALMKDLRVCMRSAGVNYACRQACARAGQASPPSPTRAPILFTQTCPEELTGRRCAQTCLPPLAAAAVPARDTDTHRHTQTLAPGQTPEGRAAAGGDTRQLHSGGAQARACPLRWVRANLCVAHLEAAADAQYCVELSVVPRKEAVQFLDQPRGLHARSGGGGAGPPSAGDASGEPGGAEVACPHPPVCEGTWRRRGEL